MVDPSLDVTYGPHRIQSVGTVSVPKELQMEVGLEPGKRVHWALNPDIPGTLILIPTASLARLTGEILDRLRQMGG